MIVLSLGRWPCEASDAELTGIDAFELRLDLMGASLANLAQIMDGARRRVPRVIATCRPGHAREEDRVALVCEAARLGAWAVDVEIDAPAASRADVARAARSHGCKVIISYHDHERTPARDTLQRVVRRAFAAGADFVKIACRVVTLADNATLLGLLDDGTTAGRIAVVGMGRLGWLTRAAAPALGSPLAYASLGPGLETADGQPTREALLRAWSALEEPP